MTETDWELSDGVISIRPPRTGDAERIVAGRDDEWRRFLGPGAEVPSPTACIVVDDTVVGWVDADPEGAHLGAGEVNVGYSVFAAHRRKGYATRGLVLLLRRIAQQGRSHTAVAQIDAGNVASRSVATKAGFAPVDESNGRFLYRRPL